MKTIYTLVLSMLFVSFPSIVFSQQGWEVSEDTSYSFGEFIELEKRVYFENVYSGSPSDPPSDFFATLYVWEEADSEHIGDLDYVVGTSHKMLTLNWNTSGYLDIGVILPWSSSTIGVFSKLILSWNNTVQAVYDEWFWAD